MKWLIKKTKKSEVKKITESIIEDEVIKFTTGDGEEHTADEIEKLFRNKTVLTVISEKGTPSVLSKLRSYKHHCKKCGFPEMRTMKGRKEAKTFYMFCYWCDRGNGELSLRCLENSNPRNELIKKGAKAPTSFLKAKHQLQTNWCFKKLPEVF